MSTPKNRNDTQQTNLTNNIKYENGRAGLFILNPQLSMSLIVSRPRSGPSRAATNVI